MSDQPGPAYLALYYFDVERWLLSDACDEMPSAMHGPYLNLMFASYREQPACRLPNDDAILWRKARCDSPDQWKAIRDAILKRFEVSDDGNWISHPVTVETYRESMRRHEAKIRAGRTAGKASARVRRNINKDKEKERTFNERSTNVHPSYTSPSPSSSQGTSQEEKQETDTNRAPGGADVTAVFDHWRSTLNHPTSKLTPEREQKIRARLRQGYTVEQLKRAIDGCKASPFHQGQNDEGRIHDDLELICRNGSKVEKFIGYLPRPGGGIALAPARASPPTPKEQKRRDMLAASIVGGMKGDGTLGGKGGS